MKNRLIIVLLTISSSFSNAQVDEADKILTAYDWINGMQVVAVKSGILGPDHVIIVDGIIITHHLRLSAALNGIYKESVKDYTIINQETASQRFEDERAKKGAIVIILERKAYKRFSKNLRKYSKKSGPNNHSQNAAKTTKDRLTFVHDMFAF